LYVVALSLMSACVPVTFALVSLDEPGPVMSSLEDSTPPAQSPAPSADFSPQMSDSGDAPARLPAAAPLPASSSVVSDAAANERNTQVSHADPAISVTTTAVSGDRLPESILRRSAPYVTIVYFAGVLVLLVRLLRGTWDSRRLRLAGAEMVDPDLSRWFREQIARLKLRVVPALRWCREISVPVVLGVVRPTILIPASAATGLSPDQLRAVIAHELAHIRRYDLAINLLQRMIETLLFFHPAVWWNSRRISREREEACDDLVLSAGFERNRYADALVRMAELSWTQHGRQVTAPATALAADGASPTEFKRRILKILRLREEPRMRPGRVALLLAATIAVVAILTPTAWICVGRSADVQAANGTEATDETMDFLKSVRPDTRITDPAAKGRELADIDLKAGTKRILYYGKPWSAGKPLIDDDTGLPVEIVSGCIVTRDFTLLVEAYNATIRAQAPAAAATGDSNDSAPDNAGDQKAFDHTIQGSGVELCFSADGTRLAVANGNPSRTMFADGHSVAKDWTPTVDVIDTDAGKVVASLDLSDLPHDPDRPFEQGPTLIEVTAIAFSPDGEVLAVGTSVGQLKLFDVRTGKEVNRFDDREGRLADNKTPDFWKQLPRVLGQVKALAFSPDGKRIAVCGESFADWTDTLDRIERGGLKRSAPGRLKVFDVETGNLTFNPPAHSDMVIDVAYSPDGKYLASAGRWMDNINLAQFGNGIILWNATTGERRAQVDLELRGWMYDIEFSPDSSRILIGAQDFDQGGGNGAGVAAMLATETLAALWRRPIERSAMSVHFNPQQAAVIVLTNREELSYIDAETGKTQFRLKVVDSAPPQKQRCENFVISPQGHLLAYGIVEKDTVHVRFMPIGRKKPNADASSGESRAAPATQDSLPPASAPVDLPDLRLEGADISVEGLRQLEGKAWGTVALSDGPLNGEIAHALARAESIRTLRILGGDIAGYVSWLHVVPGFVELELGGSILPRDLRAIGEWTQLERLKLPQQLSINVSAARSLAQLVNLKSLDLYYVDIDDASFAELAPLVQLEELDLTHTRITDQGLQTLAHFPQLSNLYLHRFPDWFIPEQLTDEGVPWITRLRRLEALSISGKITDKGLGQIAALPRLKQLDLLNTEITPAGLAALEDSSVEHLTLSAGLIDVGLPGGETLATHLRACRRLKTVTFNGSHGSRTDALADWQKLLPGIGISFHDP
jgi:beta-lactamase regulating signal transducer with metallopeptidase domain/DNA-binding beta-propeller fold protein YncE